MILAVRLMAMHLPPKMILAVMLMEQCRIFLGKVIIAEEIIVVIMLGRVLLRALLVDVWAP